MWPARPVWSTGPAHSLQTHMLLSPPLCAHHTGLPVLTLLAQSFPALGPLNTLVSALPMADSLSCAGPAQMSSHPSVCSHLSLPSRRLIYFLCTADLSVQLSCVLPACSLSTLPSRKQTPRVRIGHYPSCSLLHF